MSDIFVGFDEGGEIEVNIGQLLREAKKTLALAESCTGGTIAQRMTRHPGASDFFKGGIVAYNSAVKEGVLGVSTSLIETYSVVSEEVAEAMAIGVKSVFAVDYGVAVTGNAGPTVDRNTESKVGDVFISILSPSGIKTSKFNFGTPREKVIERATIKALELLRKELIANEK